MPLNALHGSRDTLPEVAIKGGFQMVENQRLSFGLALIVALSVLQPARVSAVCAGDCGGDGDVTVNELIVGVNIALGTATLPQCLSLDTNSDAEVTVNELIGSRIARRPTG